MYSHLLDHPTLYYAFNQMEKHRPDQFELCFQRQTSIKSECKNQEVDTFSRAQDVGLSIRVIKEKKLGFSFTTSLEKAAIDQAIQSGFEVARLMPQDEFVELPSFSTFIYPNVEAYDHQGIQVPLSEKTALAKKLETHCRQADPRITAVRTAAVSEIVSEIHLVDSQSKHIQYQNTLYTAHLVCKAEAHGDSQIGAEFEFSHELSSLDIQTVGNLAATQAIELLGAKPAPTMRCSAVLKNQVVADLIQFLSPSFSAEQIDKKRSMLLDKMGQRLFSEQVSLIDDGLLADGFATAPFDGEGIPCSKTILAEGGLISGTLFDQYYAKKNSKAPTGNTTRGIKSPPVISSSNLFLVKGKKKFNSLFDGISKGVLITHLMGVHTANPITGDFSLGASGILIENNQLTYPIRGFAVAGNILKIFRGITDVGDDLRFFGNIGAPSVRICEISVGGV